MKENKYFNGRISIEGKQTFIHIAAHSRAQAVRAMQKIDPRITDSHVRDYFGTGSGLPAVKDAQDKFFGEVIVQLPKGGYGPLWARDWTPPDHSLTCDEVVWFIDELHKFFGSEITIIAEPDHYGGKYAYCITAKTSTGVEIGTTDIWFETGIPRYKPAAHFHLFGTSTGCFIQNSKEVTDLQKRLRNETERWK